MIPSMVAIALQADGWILRSDIIWEKKNPMPESVKDRPTKSHEYLFLLAKAAKYFYDADAIKEPYDKGGRNKRTVWEVATQPYKEAHFATFPPKLITPCVLAGSKPGDIVLDPFGGSGVVAMVAVEYQRHYISIELNPEYIDMQDDRLSAVHPKLGVEL